MPCSAIIDSSPAEVVGAAVEADLPRRGHLDLRRVDHPHHRPDAPPAARRSGRAAAARPSGTAAAPATRRVAAAAAWSSTQCQPSAPGASDQPGRASRSSGTPSERARGDGVGRHALGERVGRVDDRVHPVLDQPRPQPGDPAEAADPHRARRAVAAARPGRPATTRRRTPASTSSTASSRASLVPPSSRTLIATLPARGRAGRRVRPTSASASSASRSRCSSARSPSRSRRRSRSSAKLTARRLVRRPGRRGHLRQERPPEVVALQAAVPHRAEDRARPGAAEELRHRCAG